MKISDLKLWLISAVLSCTAVSAMAADTNPVSVHILDLQTGQPTPGVQVEIEMHTKNGTWQPVGKGQTDENGRIRSLIAQDAIANWAAGEYRVVFKTGDYYRTKKQATFFPEIPVVFQVEDQKAHYHIPLLLSPFGFSTYRGN